MQACLGGDLIPKSLGKFRGLSFSAACGPEGPQWVPGQEEGGPRQVSPPLPSPLLRCWVCCCQSSCRLGLRVWGMAAEAPWDLQGLQTVGIILLLCSSLKILHALGIIDLTRGGGMGTGMGMGLQRDGDVVVEVLLLSQELQGA